MLVVSAVPVEAGALVRRVARDADRVEVVWPPVGDIADALSLDAGPPPEVPKPLVLVDGDRADVQTLLGLLETDTFLPGEPSLGHLCTGWPIIRLSRGKQVLLELRYEHEYLLLAPGLWTSAAEIVPWAQRPLNAWFSRHGFTFYERDFASMGDGAWPAPPAHDDDAAFLARQYQFAEANAALEALARTVSTFEEPPCETLVELPKPLWAALVGAGMGRAPFGTADALSSRKWKCSLDAAAANIGLALAWERLPAASDLQAVDRRTAAWVLLRLERKPSRQAVWLAVDGLLMHPDPALRRITAAWLVRLGAPGPAKGEPDGVDRLRKWWASAAPRWVEPNATDGGLAH